MISVILAISHVVMLSRMHRAPLKQTFPIKWSILIYQSAYAVRPYLNDKY